MYRASQLGYLIKWESASKLLLKKLRKMFEKSSTFQIPKEFLPQATTNPSQKAPADSFFSASVDNNQRVTLTDNPAPVQDDSKICHELNLIAEEIDQCRSERNNFHTRSLRTLDDQINAESELGRTIFGPVPANRQREFFEHRKNLWIWHETSQTGAVTIRYKVSPSGVYKNINSRSSVKLEGDELNNFYNATKKYLELIKTHLYAV